MSSGDLSWEAGSAFGSLDGQYKEAATAHSLIIFSCINLIQNAADSSTRTGVAEALLPEAITRYPQWQSSKHLNTSTYSCNVGLHVKSLVDASVRNFNRMVFCFPWTGSRCQSRSRVSESEHAYEKDIQLYGRLEEASRTCLTLNRLYIGFETRLNQKRPTQTCQRTLVPCGNLCD